MLDEALASASEFFKLPGSEKAKFMSNDVHKPVRYGTSFKDGVDKIQFWRVFLKHYAHPLADWINTWPNNPSNYRYIPLYFLCISKKETKPKKKPKKKRKLK